MTLHSDPRTRLDTVARAAELAEPARRAVKTDAAQLQKIMCAALLNMLTRVGMVAFYARVYIGSDSVSCICCR